MLYGVMSAFSFIKKRSLGPWATTTIQSRVSCCVATKLLPSQRYVTSIELTHPLCSFSESFGWHCRLIWFPATHFITIYIQSIANGDPRSSLSQIPSSEMFYKHQAIQTPLGLSLWGADTLNYWDLEKHHPGSLNQYLTTGLHLRGSIQLTRSIFQKNRQYQ